MLMDNRISKFYCYGFRINIQVKKFNEDVAQEKFSKESRWRKNAKQVARLGGYAVVFLYPSHSVQFFDDRGS